MDKMDACCKEDRGSLPDRLSGGEDIDDFPIVPFFIYCTLIEKPLWMPTGISSPKEYSSTVSSSKK